MNWKILVIILVIVIGGIAGYYFLYLKEAESPLRVITPNGNETLGIGSTQDIQWSYVGPETDRPLRIFIRKGASDKPQFTTFVASTEINKGSFSWKIPLDMPEGNDYSIVIDLEKTSENLPLVYDTSDNNFSIKAQVSCSDSDGGEDFFTRGAVDFVEPLTIKEGQSLQVMSSESAMLRFGKGKREVKKGGSIYNFISPDQVYYQVESENKSVLIDTPVGIYVRDIDFQGAGNTNNSIDAISIYKVEDKCVGNVLIENSCQRGINTGYFCVKECNLGACVR